MTLILPDLDVTRAAAARQDGFSYLSDPIDQDPDARVVVVARHSDVNIAVAAMRVCAPDFLMNP